MIDVKKLPASKVRQFYKRFANGEQYIDINEITGDIVTAEKRYYWPHLGVYNMVNPLIAVYGKDLNDNQLYGRDGLVSLLAPWQRKYNDIMNKHSVHLDYATCDHMAVEDGSVDVDELSEEGLAPGKIIVYRQGATAPAIERSTLNTDPYLESADYCYKQMVRVCEMFVAGRVVVIEDRFAARGYECTKE